MNRKTAIIGLTLLLVFLCSGFPQDNPFLATGPKEKRSAPDVNYPGFVQKTLIHLNAVQKSLYERMADLTETVQNSKNLRSLFLLIAISFSYGIVHAFGPGHGKSIAVSYFLNRRVSLAQGMLMGVLIALFHAGSAVLIVLTVYLFIRHSYLASLDNISRIIRIASYTFIILIGLYLVFTAIRDNRKEEPLNREPGSGGNSERKGVFPVALAVGIVPCPGALLILLFSLSLGALAVGIILALVMAIGMSLTISAAGCMAIFARQGIIRAVPGTARARRILQGGLRFLGALLVIVLGVFSLLGSLLT